MNKFFSVNIIFIGNLQYILSSIGLECYLLFKWLLRICCYSCIIVLVLSGPAIILLYNTLFV